MRCLPISRRKQLAFSLIELMITIAILVLLLALGAPGFSLWIKNSQIRTAAESIQNGLQLARGEAVRRNSAIRFQLTTTVLIDCALTAAATRANWVVSYDDPTVGATKCASAPLNEAFPITDAVNNPAPRILQVRSAAEGSSKVSALSDQMVIIFNGLGRSGAAATVDVTPDTGTCKASGGDVRCLRVTVSLGGQVRMCDPAYSVSGTDPQRCY
jgi:type IV fimbrial biogenesis protein FimT